MSMYPYIMSTNKPVPLLKFNRWTCTLKIPYHKIFSSNFTPQVQEARNQSQIFNRKSISRNTAHRQSYHLIQIDLIKMIVFLNKVIGLTMRSVTSNRFPIKNLWLILASFTCGVKLLEYRYAQVWIIAKRWKQNPFGWFL